MPAELQQFCAGWQTMHAGRGWTYRLWREADIDALGLRNRDLYDRAADLAPDNAWAFRTDVARYEILLSQGGVYLDCDIEPRKPLDTILATEVPSFAAWETPGRWVSNAVIGAEAGSPLLAALVSELPINVCDKIAEGQAQGRRYRANILSGPQFLTAIYLRRPDWLTVLPKAWFHPYLFSELDRGRESFPSAYGVHHWHDRRTRRSQVR